MVDRKSYYTQIKMSIFWTAQNIILFPIKKIPSLIDPGFSFYSLYPTYYNAFTAFTNSFLASPQLLHLPE